MKYYILSSGSKGNCTCLVNDENEILLIDAGLPKAEMVRRMAKYDLSFESIKAVLITHMHTDHSLSMRAFDDDMVYVNVATGMSCYHEYDYYDELDLLGFHIQVVPASHDSPGTSGFIITYNNEKLSLLTDTGYIHENIQKMISNSNIFLIESNHDPRMLQLTKRPQFLKQRILSANGHMSNADCAYVLGHVIGPKTKEIVFIHRSQEANSEEMIAETFMSIMKKMEVDLSEIRLNIAKQDVPIANGEESPLFDSKC